MIKHYSFKPEGICAREIKYTLNKNGTIQDVKFYGGCPGNSLGLAELVKGKKPDEVISLLKGIKCGKKSSSCPDQFAQALEENV